jgi:hypothetical protein
MTLKTMLLSAAMTGALMVPVYAVAADSTKPAEPAKTETAAPAAEAKAVETAKAEAAPAAAADAKEDRGAKMFAEFDTDKSGGISEDEFLNHKKETTSKMTPEQIAEKKKERFKEIDTDKDGKISEAEFKAFGEKMKAMRAEKMGKKAEAAPATDAPKSEEKAPAATAPAAK